MDNNKNMQTADEAVKNVSADLFTLEKSGHGEMEKITTPSLSFWQDAWRRLRQNKIAMLGIWAMVILIVFSILAPSSFFAFKNSDGTPFRYDSAPRLLDEDGKEIKKEDIAFLPPRIPHVEKLGIFDGRVKLVRGSWDIFVGDLPKTDEFNELKKPQNRKKLVEKLGIAYHPFEVNVLGIHEKDGQKFIKLKDLATKKEAEIPLADMISEYSKYQPDVFELLSVDIDEKKVEMLTINADEYAIKNVKNLYFWFGTDRLALDLWTRLWVGVRISLLIALISMIIDFVLGITYGTIAGFYGGTMVDNLMMRFAEIWGSIPALVLMIIMISIEKKIAQFLLGIVPSLSGQSIRFIILIFARGLRQKH